MRVQCLSNRMADLATPWPPYAGLEITPDLTTDVKPGKEYVVYGLLWWAGVPAYVLCGNPYSRYPMTYPAELFEIIDPRPSAYWRVWHRTFPASPRLAIRSNVFIGPAAWVAEPGWYEQLVDGELSAQRDWDTYKRLVEDEDGSVCVDSHRYDEPLSRPANSNRNDDPSAV